MIEPSDPAPRTMIFIAPKAYVGLAEHWACVAAGVVRPDLEGRWAHGAFGGLSIPDLSFFGGSEWSFSTCEAACSEGYGCPQRHTYIAERCLGATGYVTNGPLTLARPGPGRLRRIHPRAGHSAARRPGETAS